MTTPPPYPGAATGHAERIDRLERAQVADAEHIKGLSERVAALEARLVKRRARVRR